MILSLIIIFTLAVLSSIIAFRLDKFGEGLKASGDMFTEVLPILIFAFVLAGMMQALIPKELISRVIGKEAGLKGIVIASLIGIVLPGGPIACFPILAVFYKGGAGMGSVVAMLSSWSLLGAFRFIIFELPILGSHFALSRLAVSFIFPVIIGYLTAVIFGK